MKMFTNVNRKVPKNGLEMINVEMLLEQTKRVWECQLKWKISYVSNIWNLNWIKFSLNGLMNES